MPISARENDQLPDLPWQNSVLQSAAAADRFILAAISSVTSRTVSRSRFGIFFKTSITASGRVPFNRNKRRFSALSRFIGDDGIKFSIRKRSFVHT